MPFTRLARALAPALLLATLAPAAGAADAKDPVRFFNANYQSASISMRSVVWG